MLVVSFYLQAVVIYCPRSNHSFVFCLGWSDAPGAFPSGAYQNVRDGDDDFA